MESTSPSSLPKLEVRFAGAPERPRDRVSVLAAVDFECRWCGFRSETGQEAYLDDGEAHVACSICFDARHASAALGRDPRPRLIWAPEIGQPALAHLVRTCLVVRHLQRSPSGMRSPKRTETADAAAILASLKEREAPLRRILDVLGTGAGTTFEHAWDELRPDLRRKASAGIRMIPGAVREKTVEDWLSGESSYNGYGIRSLGEAGWFTDEIGLRPRQEPPPETRGSASSEIEAE